MAKNYAEIYNSANDSIALEQRWYAKLEASRGTAIAPGNTDFFYTLGGGSIAYAQPFESSPHRSGRHNNGIIVKKKTTSWSLTTYFNIDEVQPSASLTEIDAAIRLLFKSVLGNEIVSGGSPVFNSAVPPDLTFTLMEVGDKWSRQARGAFVEAATMTFPGNGEATIAWSGNARDAVLCGIAKSAVANTGNVVTVLTGEQDRIPIGAMVMIIKANGTTRSADTAAGSMRFVVSKSGNAITLSGATLADADGSTNPIYLAYYEPSAPAAINNPVTGLVGSMSVASTTQDCFRQVVLAITNSHELEDYCYGTDSLGDKVFVPGSRMNAAITIEANLNNEILELFNRVTEFEAQDIQLILGDAAGRHFTLDVPKAIFPVPAFAVPDTGSIPVSFAGTAYQTAFDAADEVTASFL